MAHINADELLDITWKEEYGPGMFGQGAFNKFSIGRKMKHRSLQNGKVVEYSKEYTVFGWTADGEGRKVSMGPIVAGPHASLIPTATIISASPIDRAEIVAHFEIGDTITIKGTTYTITETPVYRDLALIPVQA
jgi:hypothetical protein